MTHINNTTGAGQAHHRPEHTGQQADKAGAKRFEARHRDIRKQGDARPDNQPKAEGRKEHHRADGANNRHHGTSNNAPLPPRERPIDRHPGAQGGNHNHGAGRPGQGGRPEIARDPSWAFDRPGNGSNRPEHGHNQQQAGWGNNGTNRPDHGHNQQQNNWGNNGTNRPAHGHNQQQAGWGNNGTNRPGQGHNQHHAGWGNNGTNRPGQGHNQHHAGWGNNGTNRPAHGHNQQQAG
ncbi:hypothetical protein CSC94_08995, partial [Zhengella mangrovi]